MGTSAVSKWKDMKRLPKIDALIRLSEIFDCSVDYLGGTDQYTLITAPKHNGRGFFIV